MYLSEFNLKMQTIDLFPHFMVIIFHFHLISSEIHDGKFYSERYRTLSSCTFIKSAYRTSLEVLNWHFLAVPEKHTQAASRMKYFLQYARNKPMILQIFTSKGNKKGQSMFWCLLLVVYLMATTQKAFVAYYPIYLPNLARLWIVSTDGFVDTYVYYVVKSFIRF